MQQPDLYQPGTVLTVGSHNVVIDKYFSHGGFAQIYKCNISPAWKNGITVACLKRVNVPDKGSLGTLRKEVDAMRKLQGIDCIVSYIDSHAARSHNGTGYEVFVLMEYCPNKGLIDFMNSRLINKLKEAEILNIMEQITEAVAYMHSLNPVLIHRDIKIENVLLGNEPGVFKLCDFGSVSTIIQPASNIEEFQMIQDDVMKNTTPQYRAPEMLDLYKRQPIDQKSDIWALGILLYKLCYYTTPFEQNQINGNLNGYSGDYAIINGIYSIPSTPPYSARLKNMIAKLLVIDPNLRPNAFQLLEEICKMRGKPTPKICNPSINNALHLPKISLSSSSSTSLAAFSSNYNTGSIPNSSLKNGIHSASVTGIEHPLSGKSSLNSLSFAAATGNPTFNNYPGSKRLENTDYLQPTTSSFNSSATLTPTKLRNTPSTKKRPSSMYGIDLGKTLSRDLLTDLTTEEVVDLSSDSLKNRSLSSKSNKTSKENDHNITSSVDFLKSLSRQNTNNSVQQKSTHITLNDHSTGGLQRQTSKSKKRSSITSLKNLLTGGSIKNQHTASSHTQVITPQTSRSASLRKTSNNFYSNKRSVSTESLTAEPSLKFKHGQLSDLKEMSPESKSTKKFQNLSNITSDSSKRNSSIQSRVKNLFSNESSQTVKTAQGYGKYTDNEISSNNHINSTTITKPELLKSNGTTKSIIPKIEKQNETKLDNYKLNSSNVNSTNIEDVASIKAKKKPPPKPKKPTYLKTKSSSLVNGNGSEDDLEMLEKRFKMKFPGVV